MTDTRGHLFTEPAFIGPVIAHASSDQGWSRIRLAEFRDESLGPLWLKSHSWGEFVFDQAFARAYQEHGASYYPKLVSAIPYTPVPGPRLGAQAQHAAEALRNFCDEQTLSSAHVLFLPDHEAKAVMEPHWLRREDIRFVWRNRSFNHFDDFLALLSSKKRKNIRAERRKIAAYGFDIGWQSAAEITDLEWRRIYALYASTYEMRGQRPYLGESCLRQWGENHSQNMLFCTARQESEILAMAFFFRDGTHLYGRHWGAARDWPGLHFELCYYRGIDYAIGERLALFDAGVQGGHRLLRGFEPEISTSLHYFRDARFAEAIRSYLDRERVAVQAQYAELLASYGLGDPRT